jgi:hypothetical protein
MTEATSTLTRAAPKQVLLSGDGHYWITLDYRNGPHPSIAWIDVECGEDVQIAESFPAFLLGLVPTSPYGHDGDHDGVQNPAA